MQRNDISALDESLLYAASDGQLDQVKKLISSHNCNVNAQDQFGTTAALIAAKRNDLEMLKLLAEAGASLILEDKLGQSVVQWANFHNNQEMVQVIDYSCSNKSAKKKI